MNPYLFFSDLKRILGVAPFCVLFFMSTTAWGRDLPAYTGDKVVTSTEKPAELENVGIVEHLGKNLDLSLIVTDENGKTGPIGEYFDGKTPVILSPVYYSCPGLCNFHLNGLTDALKGVDWNPGDKFKILAVSFDFREKPDVALAKKQNYMKVYNRPGTENGWKFLTLSEESSKKLTDEIGFKFKWNEKEKEWSHASAAIVVSPTGTITRYLPGIMFEPRDVKLALNEASQGKIGNFVESLVLYCFKYNAHTSRYSLIAFNVMKLGGALIVLLMALWLLPFWIRMKREQKTLRS